MLPDTLARALRDSLATAHAHVADGEQVIIVPASGDDTTKIQVSPVFQDGPGFWLKVGDDTFTVRVTQD